MKLGVGELQRSLDTRDFALARQRTLRATTWFETTMEMLRAMDQPTLAELQNAARSFFERLKGEVDRPRSFGGEPVRRAAAFQIESSVERIQELDDQLIANRFDLSVDQLCDAMLRAIGLSLPDLDQRTSFLARRLAARAAREQMVYFVHQLKTPAAVYKSSDQMFGPEADLVPVTYRSEVQVQQSVGPTLSSSAAEYLRKKQARGLSQSQVDEVGRVLGWLQEVVGPDRPLRSLAKEELRAFRNDLELLDVTLRGRSAAFRDRLTNVREHQIKSVTSSRYWRSVQAFLAWCADEGLIESSPAEGLKVAARKGEVRRSPEPYSIDELQQLFATPLYAGYASERSTTKKGASRARGARWWSGILPLFTGLRAGELSQLFPSDFLFDAEVPHLKVREEDGTGARTKSAKNAASVRDVPLSPILLILGLREFVESQAKLYPKDRVFRNFRLGARGRKSDGMTKFWTSYLKTFGLWKPGRSTHVARHTIIARLRALDVQEEDIAAFVGHAQGTMTSKYGGAYPLERKAKTARILDYGFDIVAALGGPYDTGQNAT